MWSKQRRNASKINPEQIPMFFEDYISTLKYKINIHRNNMRQNSEQKMIEVKNDATP